MHQTRPYITGFIFSILLTLAGYWLVQTRINSSLISQQFVIYALFVLAVTQLIVQGVFFLHLGREAKPHWNLLFFIATVGIVLIVVIGAIWIMAHLNYNMTPQAQDRAILKDEGIQK